MTYDTFYCPWCDKTHWQKPCAHVKEVGFSKEGHINRIVFRDLHDMPYEVQAKHYSLDDLKGAPPVPDPPDDPPGFTRIGGS